MGVDCVLLCCVMYARAPSPRDYLSDWDIQQCGWRVRRGHPRVSARSKNNPLAIESDGPYALAEARQILSRGRCCSIQYDYYSGFGALGTLYRSATLLLLHCSEGPDLDAQLNN